MSGRPRTGADIPTIPLFDLDATEAGITTGEAVTKAGAPRAVTTASCPSCRTSGRGLDNLVGLLRQGEHLIWREHTYRTWSNAPITCGASLIAVCQLPPRGDDPQHSRYATDAACPHEKAGR